MSAPLPTPAGNPCLAGSARCTPQTAGDVLTPEPAAGLNILGIGVRICLNLAVGTTHCNHCPDAVSVLIQFFNTDRFLTVNE